MNTRRQRFRVGVVRLLFDVTREYSVRDAPGRWRWNGSGDNNNVAVVESAVTARKKGAVRPWLYPMWKLTP